MIENSGRFTSPTSNPDFPPTLEGCDKDPTTCPHMQGSLIGNTMFDAKCTRPITGTHISVFVQGFNMLFEIPINKIDEVLCGKCSYLEGVERKI